MAEGLRAPLLRAATGAPMGETIPPVSKSQPAGARAADDPHESVTIAPPASTLDDEIGALAEGSELERGSERQLLAAVEAGTRAGTSITELAKLVMDLSSGVVGAKRANERLVAELGALRALLGSASEHHALLQRRVTELEAEVVIARADAERERHFLTAQHDDFIAALIDEHETNVESRSGDRLTSPMGADVAELTQKLAQAMTERDEAQRRAAERERERDELRAEASQLRARLTMHRQATTAPPPATTPRPPSYVPPPALRLDASELDSTLHARPSQPRLATVPRLTPPPAELQQSVADAQRPASSSAFSRVEARPVAAGPTTDPAPPPTPSFGPAPSGWTPPPPAPTLPATAATATPAQPRVVSAASLPPTPTFGPPLKQKPDPTTRPLISYSLGGDGVRTEMLEGARISSKPPNK